MTYLKSVGRFTYGHTNIDIKNWGHEARLCIGAFTSIAQDVTVFLGGNHRLDWITTFPSGHIYQDELGGEQIKGHPATKGDVVICNDVWIGFGATIMSGVTIGDGAVVAANSTVVENVKPYEVVGGNPAKHIKFRFKPEMIQKLLDLEWWYLDVETIRQIAPLLSQAPGMVNFKNIHKIIKDASVT